MLIITAKKSQMEIVGLVIIVILISIALLFFLRFSLTQTTTEKRTFTNAQLTSNMINTIAKTSTNCSRITVSDLYVLCANNELVDCDNNNIRESFPCEIANNTVSFLLNNTLELWQKDFRFQVFLPDQQNTIYNRSKNFPCAGNTETETYYLQTDWGLLYLRLNVCEG
jgi:hypothetical protein